MGVTHVAVPSASGGVTQADFFATHGGGWSADHQTLPGTLDQDLFNGTADRLLALADGTF